MGGKLMYVAEDGKSLTLSEACRRLGVPVDKAPYAFAEPILPTAEELIMGGMLNEGEPRMTPAIRNRHYRLMEVG
jgi:hypothetical protein